LTGAEPKLLPEQGVTSSREAKVLMQADPFGRRFGREANVKGGKESVKLGKTWASLTCRAGRFMVPMLIGNFAVLLSADTIGSLRLMKTMSEITVDEVLAAAAAECDQRQKSLEAFGQMEPLKHALTIPAVADLRARWIAGEIRTDEAIALINAEIKKAAG